jgi:hypothetical protein
MIPIIVPTTGRVYAVVFCFFLFTWPVILLDAPRVALVTFLLMVASYIVNYWRCSSHALTYWQGLCTVAASLMGGCVNVTVFVELTVLTWIHWRSFALTLISFAAGRTYAQRRFLRLCHRACQKRFDLAAAESLITADGA